MERDRSPSILLGGAGGSRDSEEKPKGEPSVSTEIVNVGVAEYFVTHNPHTLASYGLGSCVGVALYDDRRNIGGLAHIMLPDSKSMSKKSNPGKFADTSIRAMVDEMERLGSKRRDIKARIAGGACMFTIPGATNPRNIPGPCLGMQIGERNIEAAKAVLQELKIQLVAEDTGGSYGRTMRFDISNGKVTISSIKHGAREL
ncbi:MAG: chemotaxis protein CheD [Actinobacteria bacterium]|nr:chemotaxis protein CheD [Actinomycetota bacterium]